MENNDDYAGAQKPYTVVACLPVFGRIPLLKQTIKRLYQKNGCYRVICAGDGPAEKKVCEKLGAVWVHAKNKPLGAKWNKAFLKAKEYNPDAVLYVGSSDWLSENWIPTMRPYVEQHGITGVPGNHYLDIGPKMRLVYWPGYIGERANESIGIGRMLSAKLLNLIGWKPFDDIKDNGLDGSMKEICAKLGYHDFFVKEDIKAVSISTSKWPNKHKFEEHYSNKLPSEKIADVDGFLKEFPEAYLVFK